MKHLMLILLLLMWALGAASQVSQESSFSFEKEDSISSLSIKPVKKPYRLLDRILRRIKKNMLPNYEFGTYRIDATFHRDTLTPFTASCTLSIEAGLQFKLENINSAIQKISFDGPYDMTFRDSTLIRGHLKSLLHVSPVFVSGGSFHGFGSPNPYSFWQPIGYYLGEILNPLRDYGTTARYFNVKAYSIDDATGRGAFRMHFVRNGEKRLVKYSDMKFDLGEVTGVAYFDSQTLCITRFQGNARILQDEYYVHMRYRIDYDEKNGLPVIRRARIIREADGTVTKATVQRLDQ